MSPKGTWQPGQYVRYESSFRTSIGTSVIVTEGGKAFIKPLGNKEGPHVLVCEWVGTQLAEWFGLETFHYGLFEVGADDEIPLFGGRTASEGRAFVSKEEKGNTWGGTAKELQALVNPDHLARLVVFDTWTLNCDRHPPDLNARKPNRDNVFISNEGTPAGTRRLIAMDHTHCFSCGRELTARVGAIDRVQDPRLYGLFPEFTPSISQTAVRSAVALLQTLQSDTVKSIVDSTPTEWELGQAVRQALSDLVVQRAAFVAENIEGQLAPLCWQPSPELNEESNQ